MRNNFDIHRLWIEGIDGEIYFWVNMQLDCVGNEVSGLLGEV